MVMKHGFWSLPEAERALPSVRPAQVPDGPVEYISAGSGSPTIVLVNGLRVQLGTWALVFPELAAIGTVFAYDRLGAGGTAKPGVPQTGVVIVDQLRAVLTAASVPPPYVLVGTSIGGLYVNLYARRFPQEVAGVVLLASNHPDDDVLERVLRFIPWPVARASIGLSSGSSRRNAEERFLPQTATEIARAGPFPDVPLTVVSSRIAAGLTTSPAQAATYMARQQQLAGLSPRGRHLTTPKASFIPQISDPALVVTTIRDIVNASST